MVYLYLQISIASEDQHEHAHIWTIPVADVDGVAPGEQDIPEVERVETEPEIGDSSANSGFTVGIEELCNMMDSDGDHGVGGNEGVDCIQEEGEQAAGGERIYQGVL